MKRMKQKLEIFGIANNAKIIKRSEKKMYDVENYEFEIYEILDTDFNLAS